MSKISVQCPICKTKHELDLPDGKKVYRCPNCKLNVRVMAPEAIEVPKKREPIKVKDTKEIIEKVSEEVVKEVKKVKKSKKDKSKKDK